MTPESYIQPWQKCLSIIQDNIDPNAFNMWFANMQALRYEGNKLTLSVPSHFVREYIEENYVDLLFKAVRRVFGEDTDIYYNILTDKTNNISLTQQSERGNTPAGSVKSSNTTPQQIMVPTRDLDPMLRPNYTFDNFIEGLSNKLPRAVAETIAQNPALPTFNPLFLYGASGVGKTHLINAIGLKVKELHPEKRVLYVSANLFKIQFMDATRKNTVTDFINFYQTIDVLIIDDIQEFAGAEKTQNTFFHIFNHLQQNGKQLVMSCDRPPVTLQGIVDRLITRFKGGMTAEIERPTLELRKAILHARMRKDGTELPEEVVDYIAENVTDSVRELEGILNSIIAHSTILGREADIDMASRIISRAIRVTPVVYTVEGICECVADYFHTTVADINSASRKRDIVRARQAAMYLSQKLVEGITVSRIGNIMGGKDHTSVIHSCNTVKDQLAYDHVLRSDLETIEEKIRQKSRR